MKKTHYTICAILALLLCAGQISVCAQDVVINEFMAINNSILQDEDGDYSDWLELQNISSNAVNLDGWHLTDNIDDLSKWTFPGTNLASGAFLIVFASNKDRAQSGQQLHTNFKLTGDGEYLGLVRPDGEAIEHAYSPFFPPQDTDISFGICTNVFGDLGYFTNATPAASNGLGFMELVADTKFDPDRGFYTNSFQVSITSITEEATIYYTLDGSEPTTNSAIYTNGYPLTITNTTTLRARAFKFGLQPTDIDAHSYIFPLDVIRQTGAGFPDTWGHAGADYEMDPEIVTNPAYSNHIMNGFTALPTVSMVMPVADMFGAGGVGIYPSGEGKPRAASMEYIDPTGKSFQINCSIEVFGGSSVLRWKIDKLQFRLRFKDPWGPTKLKADILGPGATDEFDNLVLNARLANTWAYGPISSQGDAQRLRAQFVREQLAADLQNDMSGSAPHGRHVHLYVCGLYWGIYGLHERPDESFAAAYFGGEKEEFDVQKAAEIAQGNGQDYLAMVNFAQTGLATEEAYQQIQEYLDVPLFIDYILANFYYAQLDWLDKQNWYASRNMNNPMARWHYHMWDAEHGIETLSQNVSTYTGTFGPQGLHQKLAGNAEYRMLFADHVQRHLFNGGVLSPTGLVTRYLVRLDVVEPAVYAESARWGDNVHPEAPYTKDVHWEAEKDRLLNDFFPYRTGALLQQMKSRGLFPSIDAPVFSQRGGLFTNGFELTLSASNTIYYTLDGRDPREYGTGQPTGTLYEGAIVLSESTLVRMRAYSSTSLWSALDEAYFVLEEPCPLRVTELMYNPRLPTDTNLPASEYEFIELRNTGDEAVSLCGLKFANGIHFDFTFGTVPRLQPGEYVVIVKNLTAFTNRYPDWTDMNIAGEFQRYREFPVANLDDGGERVTLVDALGSNILSFTYSDGRDWPLAADGAGHSLIPLIQDETQTNKGLLDYGGNWRASTFIDGSPGEADPEPVTDIVLNEIVAHTDYTNGEPWQDSDDWIELYNTTASPMSLTNWYLSDDGDDLKKWQIPSSNMISALSWIYFSEVNDFHTATNIGFGLNKAGEQVFLSYLPGTDQDRVADCVKFKGQENGYSLGRYADGEIYWYALTPTTNSANALPGERVIISEIMYHPAPTAENPEDNTNDEYVEIYNQSGNAVNLWTEAGEWRMDGGIEYDFPPNTILGGGATILLVSFDPVTNGIARTNFMDAHSPLFTPVLMGPYDGKLSNKGERLELEKPQLPDAPGDSVSWIIVDEVVYSAYSPWPTNADATGQSLVRLPGAISGNNPAMWLDSLPSSPGIGPTKMVLTTPEYGREYLVPFSLTVHAEIDSYSISGTVHNVEFFEGTNSIYVDTNGVPYECGFSRTTNESSHTFSAVITDDGGAFTSAATMVSVVGPMTVYNMGASNITDTGADIHGKFEGQSIDYANVTFYWGLTDGGINKGSWAHSEYFSRVYTNLGLPWRRIGILEPNNKTYYYRWYATRAQGEKWAGSTASFTTPTYSGWQYSMKITFAGYTGTDTLTNFPALIVLDTNSPVFSYAQCLADGADIRFSDPAVTDVLSYEIESWNTNGKSYVWVRVPKLSDSSDYIIMYWGKAFATDPPQSTDGSTWSGHYRAVWHLHGDADDSTSRKTTTIDHDSTNITGMIANGRYFDGTNSFIEPMVDTNWYGTNVNGLTLSMWVYTSGGHASYAGTPFGSDDGSGSALYMKRRARDFWEYGAQSGMNYAHKFYTGEWAYLNLVLKNGQGYAWKNDAVAGPFAYTTFTPAVEPLIGYMGGQTTNTCYFMGIIDEVRVAGTARSADWIKAEYKNVLSNSLFTSFEPPPDPPPAPPPDDDADGMSDNWEISYFGGTNISNGGPTEDWDEDGIDNESEYIAGTCPTSGNSLFMLYIGYTNGKLAVIFPALEPGTNHYGGYNRLYSLENNTNLELGAWTGIPDYTNIPGMDQIISYTNTMDSRVFFRARVRLE